MSICIYSPSTTDFSNNGLGILTPLECTVEEHAAGMYELTLVHPIDGSFRWMQLQAGFIIKAPCPVRESPEVENTIPDGATETVVTREIYKVANTSVGANLRSGPGKGYKSLGIKRNGDKVIKLPDQPSSSYMHVCVVDGGAVGYIQYKYLTLDTTASETVSKENGSSIVMPAQSREQLFRIESVEVDSEAGTATATAMHITYDWRGNILNEEYVPEGEDVQVAIGKLKTDLLMESDVILHADRLKGEINAEYSYKSPPEILFDPDAGIVKQTSAMVIRDNYDIFLLPDTVRDRGVTIRRGKNLSGVVATYDNSGIITRIIPVGRNKKGDPLYLDGQRYVDSERINDYPQIYAQRIEYDVEVGDKFKTDKAAREELLRLAKKDFENGIDLPKYGMEVDFVMLNDKEYQNYAALQAVHLYDTVTVVDELINTKAKLRVTAYEWDALARQYISVTLGNLQELSQMVYGYQLPSQSVSGDKIINNSVAGTVLRNATIQYAKIAVAAIEQLNANSITAVTAKIQEIVSGKLTTDELYAAIAEVVALKVGNLTANDITTDNLAAALAQFTVLTAGTAEFDRATVQHLVAEALNLQFGTAEQVFIKNLAVEYAQMVGATIGNLCVKASDGNYYNIDVDASGNVIATATTVSDGEINAGQTEGGKVILDTNITAGNLNASNLLATYALINQIDAARIDVDQLFAREAFVNKLITSRIFADGGNLEIVAETAGEVSKWFRFTNDRGLIIRKPKYTDADGVERPASIWYTVTDEVGYHIYNDQQYAPVGSFQRGGLTTTGVQIGDIVTRKTSSGGWVWTDAT